MSSAGLAEAVSAMRGRGVPEAAVAVFTRFHGELERSATGYVLEESIAPLTDVTALDDLPVPAATAAREALARVAVIRLNGGLGTSMGLSGPKTALVVRDGLTFLDLIVRQTLDVRATYGAEVPLVLLDSFRTSEESLAGLARYPELAVPDLPLDMLQSAEPKLDAETLAPVHWPADPDLEWCPPGHGDVYVTLAASGVLDLLRRRGVRYAFLSNADNLGATCDPRIPAWMLAEGIPYVAEVCDRTVNDRKGGHLAVRRADGRLILRESANVAPGEEGYFADVERHPYFHANNLWVDLDVLAARLDERSGDLGLPLIVNRKTVDPTRPDSPRVIQVESAMGSAVELFDGAVALVVPRRRFRPVKTTNELLLVRSDRYRRTEAGELLEVVEGPEPLVDLSGEYRFVAGFEERFPEGVPSLREATSFVVDGDVTFEAGVVCRGAVEVVADEPRTIRAGTVLSGREAS